MAQRKIVSAVAWPGGQQLPRFADNFGTAAAQPLKRCAVMRVVLVFDGIEEFDQTAEVIRERYIRNFNLSHGMGTRVAPLSTNYNG